VQLYQLRALPAAAPAPQAAASAASPATAPAPLLLQLGPVSLPEYLDRATLLRRQGAAGLQALEGHRWAEPLADAVPRVLQQALSARLGAERVWLMPLPAGLRATQQLRVQVQRLDADEDGAAVVLQARCGFTDPTGQAAPRVRELTLRVPTAGASPDALAAAHAQALDQLAAAIAAELGVR
jgi:uncharacterized lipoprotein YmbA